MDVEKLLRLAGDETAADLGRRTFLGATAMAGAFLAACSAGTQSRRESVRLVPGPQQAPDGRPLKAGLIGCGGRGTGAAVDFLSAGPNLQIVALADLFQDQIDACRKQLKEQKGVEIADDHCFVGWDAYQKLLATDIDVVLQATPPHFRPAHFAAAVEARKHVFMEKPVAVDPVGVRSVIATAEKADAFGLCVVTGTQYRHQKSFIETFNRIQDGMIGDILAARGYSLRGQLWYREPRPEWSEMEAMLRDWVNWQWLSGDHIVEQHIHGIDVLFWFTGQFPTKAVAVGGRARRVTGDQYDFFANDWELESGIHMSTICRQIDGCTNNISRWVVGTKGYSNCENTIYGPGGEVVWKYEGPNDNSPYVQEHVDLVTAIRQEKQINEAVVTAKSTLGAIMARESAYTGLEVSWNELMQSSQRLGPTEYSFGPVGLEPKAPVPGTSKA
ncbi:MAG: Gfo/Idh/MocA family oxidoreductase [Acidobacteriota bacterium]